jgi:hypothetical protein
MGSNTSAQVKPVTDEGVSGLESDKKEPLQNTGLTQRISI